jgi:fructokinase
MSAETPLIAAIEAGGTKFNCAVGRGPNEILASTRIATTTPRQTLDAVLRFFAGAKAKHGGFAAMGVGCFGPVDLDEASESYGSITSTPKRGWQNTDIVGALKARFRVPIGFDTDVNGAVLGEYYWGAGQGLDPLVYLTVGTGVGGGVLIGGKPHHGLLHPEIGHLQVPAPKGSNKDGHCPFHRHCVEGYVSGPAIAARWGVSAEKMPADSPAWNEVAEVLAALCVNLTLTLSPRRIILGGGVMKQTHLLPLIQGQFKSILNGYLRAPELGPKLDHYLVAPMLGDEAGLIGALALGRIALNQSLQ